MTACPTCGVTREPVAYAKYNGAGEFIFRQAGHPSYHDALVAEGWQPLYAAPSGINDLSTVVDTSMTATTHHNPWRLANMAGVATPDDLDSEGALFLERVQSDVNEALEDNPDGIDVDDAVHEIADGAVPIYTHQRWRVFVDLCAYSEDLDDLGGSSGDMTQDAGIALYIIAERLATALLNAAVVADEDEDGAA